MNESIQQAFIKDLLQACKSQWEYNNDNANTVPAVLDLTLQRERIHSSACFLLAASQHLRQSLALGVPKILVD